MKCHLHNGMCWESQGSTEQVVICDSQQDFAFRQLNYLSSRSFSQQEKKIKIKGIINGSVTFK